MFVVKISLIILLFVGVLCVNDDEETPEDTKIREGRDYDTEKWQGVDSERIDMSGWIPQDRSTENTQGMTVVKRRRLRKRKRRPSRVPESDDYEEQIQDRTIYVPRRRFRPLRLRENDQVWEDMEEENSKRPSNRRRIIPIYNSDEITSPESETKILTEQKIFNSPLEAVIRFEPSTEETQKTKPVERIRDPFDALKEAEEKQRTPPTVSSSNLKSLLKKNGVTISLSEILQQKNLSLSELLKGNAKAISALTEPFVQPTQVTIPNETTTQDKISLESETATEKRIYVPSHPKHYTTASYKPIILEIKTTSPKNTEDFNVFKSEYSNTILPPKSLKKLPITSAKLASKPITNKPKSFTVSLKNSQMEFEKISKIPTELSDEPLKISLDLTAPKNSSHTSQETVDVTDEEINDKLKVITAQEEILDMLKDPIYKERLSKILQERNMTIQELVEQRERGSSQLHLADIFHNKTREPEPVEEPYIGIIQSDNLPLNFREQKGIKLEETQPSTTIKPVQEKVLANPITLDHMNGTFNFAAVLPFWKQFHPELFNQIYQSSQPSSWNDLQRIEEVDNKLSNIINDKLDAELKPKNYHLDQESFFDIPAGIKSALVASFAIVMLSLIIFLTILVIFKLAQRTKRKLNYTGSLSGNKIKSPILEIPHRNALKSFVCETLGRRTNYYKSHLQSMSDAWDDKKRKQKF